MPEFSIVIPTLGRTDSLKDCLESLWVQSFQDFEVIKVTEEGPLAKIRNEGAKRAKGEYLVFIDDDVVCYPEWLAAIKRGFELGNAGVTGPAYIGSEFRTRRDIFKFDKITRLFSNRKPGHLSKWGMHSMAAAYFPCDYNGEVEYLEACNMAFKASVFRELGGFDEQYGGVGEWEEPDLCFKARELGHHLWFTRDAVVEHRPSQGGAYPKRLRTLSRITNYELFSRRWIKPCWKHSLYKLITKLYFWIKESGWLD